MVARAAPGTPISKAKIKMGSSMILSAAPSTVVSIPILGSPWALINWFIPVLTMAKGVPSR